MGNNAPLIAILLLIFAMFYFLMIRPIRRREKGHDAMAGELRKGDEIVTASGIYGQIEEIDDDSVVLKVESGATIRMTKGCVLRSLDRGDPAHTERPKV